jgi:hypothetical protein
MTMPLKVKGVRELGISGVAAAVANAICATSVTVHHYPIAFRSRWVFDDRKVAQCFRLLGGRSLRI